MLSLRDPADVTKVEDGSIRELLAQRFEEICQGEDYDPDEMGYFVLIQAGDSIDAIEQGHGIWITRALFSDARFGDEDFAPCFECLEEHPTCYELVFILNDGGYGVVILIPKSAEIDPELLNFCQTYATPSPERLSA